MRRRAEADRGSATVLVLACVLAGSVLAALWLAVGQGAMIRQRAETAADLAALAAAGVASAVSTSTPAAAAADPCAAAATIASRNGAQLTSCSIEDGQADVTVAVSGPPAAHARARAGPVSDPPALR